MNENKKQENTNPEEEINLDMASDNIDIEASLADSKEEISQEDIINDLEDQILRAKAEVQNVRRIAAQEVTKARLFGVESLAREFLSVSDNLERAIISCQSKEDGNVIQEGLELTLKSLETSLKTSGIELIDCENQSLDPE